MFHRVKTFFPLLRVVPVISWSLSAFAISAGFAVHDLHSAGAVDWTMFGVLLVCAFLLQGVVVQSLQDRAASKAGAAGRTEKTRPERARESRALPERGTFVLGLIGLTAAVTFGVYAAQTKAMSVWLILLVGVWTALSYTCHPFRYVRMMGEWLAAFPAIVLCTLGSYFVLTDAAWEPVIGWAAVLHSMLCVAWLMQYHLGDLASDRNLKEDKSTVAWTARKFGVQAARHVPAGYFLLTAFVGMFATLQVAHLFLLTVVCSLLGAFNSWNTNLRDVRNIAGNQLRMIMMTVLHAAVMAMWVAWT
jgi:1,4-dihydroxy-2-naphthoate polyprenyltransferase